MPQKETNFSNYYSRDFVSVVGIHCLFVALSITYSPSKGGTKIHGHPNAPGRGVGGCPYCYGKGKNRGTPKGVAFFGRWVDTVALFTKTPPCDTIYSSLGAASLFILLYRRKKNGFEGIWRSSFYVFGDYNSVVRDRIHHHRNRNRCAGIGRQGFSQEN